MLLISLRESLSLLRSRAYSYDDNEFRIVRTYFNRQKLIFEEEQTRPYKDKRKGHLFTFNSQKAINQRENKLDIDFSEDKANFRATKGGQSYRCMRVKHDAAMKGNCQEFEADDGAAFIKCALQAKKENWFGGKSERGSCKDLR